MKRLFIAIFALLLAVPFFGQAKYVFYFIGDGMGPNVVLATEMYLAELKGKISAEPLCMTQFPYYGSARSFSTSNSVTDSSAAGTCLAAGYKTTNGKLGIDDDGKHHPTIAEILKKRGYSIGIMTSVSIDHATPGAFYAQVPGRNDYYDIAKQMIGSEFDFFGGSWVYQPVNKKNDSDPSIVTLCKENDYEILHGHKDFLKRGKEFKKVILVQEHEALDLAKPGDSRIPYAIDNVEGALTLPEITSDAIDFLSAKGQPFFMMVEGGQIDWANHANDGATAIGEVIEFDKSIQRAFEFYKAHPKETLIVVTADHETGGLALGNSDYTLHLERLQHQKMSAAILSERFKELHRQYGKKLTFDQVKTFFSANLGLYSEVSVSAEDDAMLRNLYKLMMKNKAADSKNMYASLDALSDAAVRLLNKSARLGWTTHSHSAAAVPVYAIGVGAEQFTGFYDNTEIMHRMLKATGK